MDGCEPTQATQHVLDPRRVGKQNSGFSDDEISDIICVLYPRSEPTRQEVQRLADQGSPHIIGKGEADGIAPNYELEDHASRFEANPISHGEYSIKLRLSAQVKNPMAGFTFGRNPGRCDIVFSDDPYKRVSNVHFRIYVNEYYNVMIEDQSTNGTFVDAKLLSRQPKNGAKPITQYHLRSGCIIKILLHDHDRDLVFLVRIPHREHEYESAYNAKVDNYFAKRGLKTGLYPGGHVDLFKSRGEPVLPRVKAEPASSVPSLPSPPKAKGKQAVACREWTGSGTYNRVNKIGQGAFAVVYRVTSIYDGMPYAAKEIEKRRFIKNGIMDQKVENEMKIMRRVQHPNIVRFIESLDWEDRLLVIIMEYISGGDLGKHIVEYGALPEDSAQIVARQLSSALGYLHTNNITHRDVKPDNVLIKTLDPLEVKLTDFGLSKIVDTEQTFLKTFCGTLYYCAPEVYTEYEEYDDKGIRSLGKKRPRLRSQRYNHAVDVWSLGGVIFYTMTGSPPYPVKAGTSPSELLHRLMTTTLDVSPLRKHSVSELGVEFIQSLLQRRPEHRAAIQELERHAWLGGPGAVVEASQSYDVMTDEEDTWTRNCQPALAESDDDRISDSEPGEPAKGDNLVTQRLTPPRLFGEVDISAVGSSGVLPDNLADDLANDFGGLPTESLSMGETEILLGSHQNQQAYRYNERSVFANQSADQLLSLVDNVASQSLGGRHSREGTPAMLSESLSQTSLDPSSSKRKSPFHEVSDDFDEDTPPANPTLKRLRSLDNDDSSENLIREFELLSRIPQVKRLGSGRLIDKPVSKIIFWEQDRSTWHLRYPEMTQLQYDAFSQAARDRGEELGPGKSPLWDLAMKYFPPGSGSSNQSGIGTPGTGQGPGGGCAGGTDETQYFPPTAPPEEARPSARRPVPEGRIVPVQVDYGASRAIAVVESAPESCVRGIEFSISDSLVSFGRSSENTEIFKNRMEPRVPKNAFKIMLWREGFDPSSKTKPWQMASTAAAAADDDDDVDSYHFWISTKATLGIRINGHMLASSDAKHSNSPSVHWAKLKNGDSLMIWAGQEPSYQTRLVFRCFWGGSSKPRSEQQQQLELASPSVAQKLDAACLRTEKRMRETAEKEMRASEAEAEHQRRLRQVDQERERSREFEKRRLEAIDFMAATRRGGERRASPAVFSPGITQMGRLLPGSALAARLGGH